MTPLLVRPPGSFDAEVDASYATDYWLPPRCDRLDTPLDLVQFDTAVNMGVGRAVRFLQASVGCGVDGDFGPTTELMVVWWLLGFAELP